MKKLYYCPICGDLLSNKRDPDLCLFCCNMVSPIESSNEINYYKRKSKDLYGNKNDYHKILIEEEVSKNPYFEQGYINGTKECNGKDFENRIFYCPICGKAQEQKAKYCTCCLNNIRPIVSLKDIEYYRNKSLEQHGDYSQWEEILIQEEASKNPQYNPQITTHSAQEQYEIDKRGYNPNVDIFLYYCPICSKRVLRKNYICSWCSSRITPVQSLHEIHYYRSKSIEKYGSYYHIADVLIEEESSQNPRYDPEITDRKIAEKHEEEIQKITEEHYTPKCPVCQSPNIQKISDISRVAHGVVFGLFSKTARSQWKCNNCGNLW